MSPNGDGQADLSLFGNRLREAAEKRDMTAAKLAEALGITRGTLARYWNGERLPPAPLLFAISDVVGEDAGWLVRGRRVPKRDTLVDAEDADWVSVPKYDLREASDVDLGEPVMSLPMRRDWLYSMFRKTSGLWITRLLWSYPSANLEEGMMVVCCSLRQSDLTEGHICIWRVDERLVIGRFSIKPDDPRPYSRQGAAGGLADFINLPPGGAGSVEHLVETLLNNARSELTVAPSQLDRYHLVGRVLGVLLRPL